MTARRAAPVALATLTSAGLLIYLAEHAGGYFPPAYLRAGAIAFLVLGILVVAEPPRFLVSTQALLALGSLAALAVWTGLSANWSASPDTALEDLQRQLAYVGLFALGMIAAGSGRYARHVVWVVLAVVVWVVVARGLGSRLFPADIHSPAPAEITQYRLGFPLGYWNAFGALAALGVTLAAGLAADPRSPRLLRALAGAATVPLAVAMYLSLSRGAWMALVAGLVALLLLGAHRPTLLFTALLLGTTSVAAVLALHRYPALVHDPLRGIGQEASGHRYADTLIRLTIVAGVGQLLIAQAHPSEQLQVALRRVLRPVGIAVAALLVLGALGVYAFKSSAVDRRVARASDDATSWIDRQWKDFLRPTTAAGQGTARLTSARGTRSDLYRVALDGFAAHPLWGDGAGGFEPRFLRTRRVNETVRNAHSLELETLGELGLVGGALLLTFLGAVLFAAVRARVRPGALPRSQAAAVGAAVVVWVVHSAVDWDWQMPALTGAALLLAATLLPYGRGVRRRRSRRGTKVAGEQG